MWGSQRHCSESLYFWIINNLSTKTAKHTWIKCSTHFVYSIQLNSNILYSNEKFIELVKHNNKPNVTIKLTLEFKTSIITNIKMKSMTN